MSNLFRAELYRIKYYKASAVLSICICLIAILSAAITRITSVTPAVNGSLAAFYAPLNSMYLLIIIPVFASDVIIADFSNGIIRNMFAIGIKRSQVLFGKMISLYLETWLFMVLCIAAYTGFYTFIIGWGTTFAWNQVAAIIRLIVLLSAFIPYLVSFVTLISVLLRNTLATIGVCSGTAIFEIILANIGKDIPFMSKLVSLLPVSLSNNLLTPEPTHPDIVYAILFSIVAFLVTTILGAYLFRYTEIK